MPVMGDEFLPLHWGVMVTKTSKRKLEDYEPGATQAQVHKALKKVAKAKPSRKPS
jgi:hypothetical protein